MNKNKYATCHPNKLNHSRGLCDACYTREYRKNVPLELKKIKNKKDYQRRKASGKIRYYPQRWREYHLRCEFGLSIEQYNEILLRQNGVCPICGKSPSEQERFLSVDHDHKTGRVRGLLCTQCNRGIGIFHERYENLLRAAEYIKSWSMV